MNRTEFIEKSRKVHGDRYDYSKVEYVNNRTKVCIICPIHGEFWQTPDKHLRGQNCPFCSKTRPKEWSEVYNSFIEIHGDEFDYSKVNFKNMNTKVCIIHKKCGNEFWQTPKNHLKGQDMPFIKYDKIKSKLVSNKEEFINKAKEIHNDKYDYSKVEYVNSSTKVCIICPKHGEFWQTPSNHLKGQGCPICKESILEKEIVEILDKNGFQFIRQKKFYWLKNKKSMSLDFFLPIYNIAIECQGSQHFFEYSFFQKSNPLQNVIYRDVLKFNLCKEHGIDVLYYTNENFLKNNQTLKLSNYKDNIFIDNKIINRIKYGKCNKNIY